MGGFQRVSELSARRAFAELQFDAFLDRRAGDARRPVALLSEDRRRASRGRDRSARTARVDDPPHPLQPAPGRSDPPPRRRTLHAFGGERRSEDLRP